MKKTTKKEPAKRAKKENAVAVRKQEVDENIVASIILKGDISGLDEAQRTKYNVQLCKSLGLNPLTQPFQILKLQGKEVLYATKTATEQLRKVYGVSVTSLDRQILNDICIVTANVQDKTGRTDAATGAVNIAGQRGNDLANSIMKAETKAKRRATLSICGLGMLDESEIETISATGVQKTITGEIINNTPEEVPPMTIESACDKLRQATNMRGLVTAMSIVKDAARWNDDDNAVLREISLEMKKKFQGAQ